MLFPDVKTRYEFEMHPQSEMLCSRYQDKDDRSYDFSLYDVWWSLAPPGSDIASFNVGGRT
jgi:hypothetical protein